MVGLLDDLGTSLSSMQFGRGVARVDTEDITSGSSVYSYPQAYFSTVLPVVKKLRGVRPT
jgi:hypothetical protein